MMKVLWITNGLFPEAEAALSHQNELKGSGGWLLGLSEALIKKGSVKLVLASTSPLVKNVTRIEGEHMVYYAIPYSGDSFYNHHYEKAYGDICQSESPDLVHIHGTEYPHALAALRACGSNNTVVSLQGLVSEISKYYLGGLHRGQILRNPTIHDLLRLNLFQQQREMARRGQYEIQLLKEAVHVMGRTDWDKAHVMSVNPGLKYYHLDEILRAEFYDIVWAYERCVPHSIFLSQGYYPLKGLHKVLEAMPLVLRQYPDASLRIAGIDLTHSSGGRMDRMRVSSYGRIIRRMIEGNHLQGHVCFLGPLNAREMKDEYLRSNVFVCPSSIENSPNSLGEAQVLGVPCIASYVGGVPYMMKGDEAHLYHFEESSVLADKICQVFDNTSNQAHVSFMRQLALKRHNPETIVLGMMDIYGKLLQ